MDRIGGSLVGVVALCAAVVVAVLGGLSSAPERFTPRAPSSNAIRIGVYDERVLVEDAQGPVAARPAEAIDAALATELPELARRAGVVAITARTAFHAEGVELVDVTEALRRALHREAPRAPRPR